jgi:hypothetical protein
MCSRFGSILAGPDDDGERGTVIHLESKELGKLSFDARDVASFALKPNGQMKSECVIFLSIFFTPSHVAFSSLVRVPLCRSLSSFSVLVGT